MVLYNQILNHDFQIATCREYKGWGVLWSNRVDSNVSRWMHFNKMERWQVLVTLIQWWNQCIVVCQICLLFPDHARWAPFLIGNWRDGYLSLTCFVHRLIWTSRIWLWVPINLLPIHRSIACQAGTKVYDILLRVPGDKELPEYLRETGASILSVCFQLV